MKVHLTPPGQFEHEGKHLSNPSA